MPSASRVVTFRHNAVSRSTPTIRTGRCVMDRWDVLVIAGALLEVGGGLLLVTDVVSSLKRQRAYRSRPQTVYVGASLSAEGSLMVAAITGGREPTVEERVAALEGSVRTLRDTIDEQRTTLRDELRKDAEQAARHVGMRADDRFDAIEAALLGESKSETRRRLASVGAVVLGVALATWGSVAAP
jgi:hypothetical protein